MKDNKDRWREYEIQKSILIMTCETSEELSAKLKELVKKLKI